jgi:phosphoribosylformylglycinamidine cyclo-ligase
MGATAVYKACAKMKAKGIKPLSMVDDLSMHAVGPWIDDFAYGLAAAAKREGISIVGGEMAQMGGTYREGCVSVVVYVTGIR